MPAVRGRVAQREVRRHVGRRELLEEPAPGRHRQHHDRRPGLVRRHHEPLVARGPGGRDRQRERGVPGRCGRDAGRVVRRRRGRFRPGRRREGGVPRPAGPARDRGLEDRQPPAGEHVGVPLGRRVEGAGAQPVAQVVVGAEPEQRRGHAGDRLGRDEQPVHLVPDDLARTGGAVEGHAGDAGRHRLLQPEREPLGPRGERADARPGPLAGHVGRAARQLDAVPEPALAGLADQVRPLVALAEDPQPPARAAGRRRRRRPPPAW